VVGRNLAMTGTGLTAGGDGRSNCCSFSQSWNAECMIAGLNVASPRKKL
jgi:hypothetical protein